MWFITCVEKIENESGFLGFADTGESRCWGFFSDKDHAVHVVENNLTDIHEFCYNYVVIEEYDEGICNEKIDSRMWFKWNDDKETYVRIEEPPGVQHLFGFAFQEVVK